MIPQKFRSMLGIKDEQDLKTANNIWKMLDQMSSNDPTAYEKFIQKNLAEGLTDAKAQKQKKQKPYKIVPQQYMLLQMQAKLQQQILSNDQTAQFKEKLDININKQKWSDVKSKFPNRIHIFLNICFTDRIKNPTSKLNKGKQIKQFNISMISDIQSLYYSLQGPQYDIKKQKQTQQPKWYYCMIFNTNFLKAFDIVPNGKRILLGMAVAYFQQRLKNDRNPILMKVNTHALYGKNLYYGIQKQTIQVNQSKKFKFGKQEKVCQFLLEQEIDIKQRQKKGKKQQKMIEKQKNTTVTNPMKKKQPQILIKPKQQQKNTQTSQLPPLVPSQPKPNKKVLIQVLDEKNTEQNSIQDNKIPYEMKQSQDGYTFEFLVHGIQKITDLDLQVSTDQIKLKTINHQSQKFVEIKLDKKIDDGNVKAKMKKKSHTLQVTLSFKK